MKFGFYPRLSWNNIMRNSRFFLPRICTEAGLVACFYIVLTLAMDDRMRRVNGGNYIPTFMWMGVTILALLSGVLMLYINRFLMKQRKREFGVYNVLGIEKRHVGKVLFYENSISSLLSIAAGILTGMLLYKICSLLICRLLQTGAVAGFYYVTPLTIFPTVGFFLALDFSIFLLNLVSIALMKPVELLQSCSAGEKEPKVKWVMLILGVLTIGIGYYLTITTESPLNALMLFFAAVLLIIIGTYFLFVAGSIFVLKMLRNNENFYYRPQNMPAVGGLLYRMKQNAVGLASIAILATGVLVMISTTMTLYAGIESVLTKHYPQHLYLEAGYSKDGNEIKYLSPSDLESIVSIAAEKHGAEIKSVEYHEYLLVSYYMADHALCTHSNMDVDNLMDISSDIGNYFFMTENTYRALTGETLDLSEGEIVVCSIYNPEGLKDITGTLTIHGKTYRIKGNIYHYPISANYLASMFSCYGVVVPDEATLAEIYGGQKTELGQYASEYTRRVAVTFADLRKAEAAGDAINQDIIAALGEISDGAEWQYTLDTRWSSKETMLGMFGTLLFLGLLLGAVCLFATALIIYYKQISEGYEDRTRFQIMEKIGMSRQEVKKTISKQVLLVFFLPLGVAGIHMAAMFPILIRLMKILLFFSIRLFVICTLATFAVFALVYVLIYLGTSKTYYQIVR